MRGKRTNYISKREFAAAMNVFAPAGKEMEVKPKQQRANHEHGLQVECVKWFRLAFPKFKDVFFAIPNGGARNVITAKNLKDEGVLAGIPDLMLAVAKHGFNGLFIEMKYGSNKPSEEQKERIAALKAQNYEVSVCYSFEDFKTIINFYLND
jgi:hypothetical protein